MNQDQMSNPKMVITEKFGFSPRIVFTCSKFDLDFVLSTTKSENTNALKLAKE
jgi:hypothetical protein